MNQWKEGRFSVSYWYVDLMYFVICLELMMYILHPQTKSFLKDRVHPKMCTLLLFSGMYQKQFLLCRN